MFMYFNPNPMGRSVKDCAVRAIAGALNVSWEEAYDMLTDMGKKMGDMPDGDNVWGAVLRMNGFRRMTIPNTCPTCYTVAQFAYDHPKGMYVLYLGGHVTLVYDGKIYDTWDTSYEIPTYVWY